jgi:C4-type Zn-finger protein
MPQANKMICPECAAEMNLHAVKLDYSIDEPAMVDPVFGGVLNEAHTCPECGCTEVRRAL